MGGEIAESLMGADGVVGTFPVTQFAIQLFEFERIRGDLIKLLGVSAIGAFDRAVEFGRTGRQHEQVQPALLASLLELSRELRSAIHLQGTDGKGHAMRQGVEELGGALRAGASVGLQDIPARNQIGR